MKQTKIKYRIRIVGVMLALLLALHMLLYCTGLVNEAVRQWMPTMRLFVSFVEKVS